MSIQPERLKQVREAQGLSQRELARQCNISDVLIYRYEGGHSTPSTKHLITIAKILGVSMDYLAGLTDSLRGQMGDNPLDDEEKQMVETFRRQGWPGVIRLGGEQLLTRQHS